MSDNSSGNSPLLPTIPGESARAYEALSFWIQSGKVNKRVAEQFNVTPMTVTNWKRDFRWEERALELERARAISPYSKELAVNEAMGKIAIEATELVTRSGLSDYEAMLVAWRRIMVEANDGEKAMPARDFRDMINAYDVIDQIGRRVARLPNAFKQNISSYGQGGGEPKPGAEETIEWN